MPPSPGPDQRDRVLPSILVIVPEPALKEGQFPRGLGVWSWSTKKMSTVTTLGGRGHTKFIFS